VTKNVLVNNFIGLGADGSSVPNHLDGVLLDNVSGNQIGMGLNGYGNVISANLGSGVNIYGAGSTGNNVQGNDIGTDISGLPGRGNQVYGVVTQDARNNLIGGYVDNAAEDDCNAVLSNKVGAVQLLIGGQVSTTTATGNQVPVSCYGTRGPSHGTSFSLSGPEVVSVNTQVVYGQRVIVVRFNELLSTQTATLVGDYKLAIVDALGNVTGKVDVSSVRYNATAKAVVIRTVQPINLRTSYRLTILGTGSQPIADAGPKHLALDGAKNGKPGSDFQYILRATVPALAVPQGPMSLK
jgi:hypothetical protein